MYRTIKITVCLSCVIIIVLMSSYALLIRRMPIMTGYDCTDEQTKNAIIKLQQEYVPMESTRTRADYRKIIEDDFNCRFYFYREADLPEGVDGQCQPLFRTITMDSYIDNFFYCSAFAHEMIHLTSYIEQENYVTYQTFKYLYEHNDPELHNFGVKVGLLCLYNAYPTEYDCNGEVIGYLATI